MHNRVIDGTIPWIKDRQTGEIHGYVREDGVPGGIGLSRGWRDMMAQIEPRGTPSGPTWTNFRNGIWLYAFPSNQNREVFAAFHLDHDYEMGSAIYPHVHFSVNTTTAGTVRWGIEYTVAKGHGQAAFGATTTILLDQVVTADDQHRHFITEASDAQAIPGADLEPDTQILVRLFRDVSVAGNLAANAFGIQIDMHYRAAQFATPRKSPDFFAE